MDSKRKNKSLIQSFLIPSNYNLNGNIPGICNRSSYPQTYVYPFYTQSTLIEALKKLERDDSHKKKYMSVAVQTNNQETKDTPKITRTIETQYNKEDLDVDWIMVNNNQEIT